MTVAVDKKLATVLQVKSEIVRAAGEYLRKQGFIEILPVILSPVTDPLHHETYDGVVDYYGRPYTLTKSMILHKQIALRTVPRIFAFSPNVRMEPEERAPLRRYLAEFVQLDLEVRDATRDEIMEIGEGLFIAVVKAVRDNCAAELESLGRELEVPRAPFARIAYQDAVKRFGEHYDEPLSASLSAPAWLIDFPREVREFYDREDPDRPGILLDMDLIYPEGYGEALSGGEREHTFPRILRRLEQDGISPDRFAEYLRFAEEGLPASAGFGIGIERLTRYICGLDHIKEARLFPKVPGEINAL
ncbi:asparagine synthetase [Candidatus Bipolaricaulota bacterium]|nr:asparagine synthetase [Candidatus Bipolaricaulota bacterium]